MNDTRYDAPRFLSSRTRIGSSGLETRFSMRKNEISRIAAAANQTRVPGSVQWAEPSRPLGAALVKP
jgi:hypothetical protein